MIKYDIKLNSKKFYQRMINTLNSLKHKNIIQIYKIQIKPEKNCLSILMEKAERDWAQEIELRSKRMAYYSKKELFTILKQLTSGLSYLQKNNIAHRDIKPHNILVFPENVYKSCDMTEAIALIKNRLQNGVVRGSELFMSPLLYEGLKSGGTKIRHNLFKSDVFSIGYCILYAMDLNINLLYNIRELKSTKNIERKINEKLKYKYQEITDIVINMVKYEEKDRYEFQQLEKELNKMNL